MLTDSHPSEVFDRTRWVMVYQDGDIVIVVLPSGDEVPGVVGGEFRPGFYLVHVQDTVFASVIVGPHRLRPADAARTT